MCTNCVRYSGVGIHLFFDSWFIFIIGIVFFSNFSIEYNISLSFCFSLECDSMRSNPYESEMCIQQTGKEAECRQIQSNLNLCVLSHIHTHTHACTRKNPHSSVVQNAIDSEYQVNYIFRPKSNL